MHLRSNANVVPGSLPMGSVCRTLAHVYEVMFLDNLVYACNVSIISENEGSALPNTRCRSLSFSSYFFVLRTLPMQVAIASQLFSDSNMV